jgi:hypothetical protein
MTLRNLPRLFIISTLAVAAPALAQTPPRSPDVSITSASGPLSADQTAKVRSWADYWSARLGRADVEPESIESARDELVRPLSPLNQPSGVFRDQYARALVDSLAAVIKGDDEHAAVNAVIVASGLGTDSSLDLLLRHANSADEPRDSIRMRAASGCYVTIMDATDPDPAKRIKLQGRTLNRSVRELGEAAGKEQDPIALRYQLYAMLEVDTAQAREELVEAIRGVIEEIRGHNNGPSPLIEPVHLALAGLRNQYISPRLDAGEKRTLGTQLGPCLGRLLDVVNQHWANARAAAQTEELYKEVVGVSEVFLGLVDGQVRGPDQLPRSNFRGAWAGDDPAGFSQDLQRWNAVLSRDPYKDRN